MAVVSAQLFCPVKRPCFRQASAPEREHFATLPTHPAPRKCNPWARLTRRCSGLASLAAELHIVRPRWATSVVLLEVAETDTNELGHSERPRNSSARQEC